MVLSHAILVEVYANSVLIALKKDQPECTDAVNFTNLVTEIKTYIKNFLQSLEFDELASFDGKI